MEKKTNTPALRFRGFDGPWEKKQLGDITEISSGFMGDSFLNKGKYRLTRIETIADGTVDEERIGYTNVNPGDAYRMRKGDILYSNINSIDHIGKVAQYQSDTELYHGINLLRLSMKNGISSDFLINLLNTPTHRKWAQTHANQAVSQASINRTILASQSVMVCSLEEQESIGNFIRECDRIIFTQKQKIKKLEQFRQAMLTKLFPAEGASEPALRFRGFSGPWDRKPFGELAMVRRGLTYSPENVCKNGIRVLRSSNIQENTFTVASDDVFVDAAAVNIPTVKNGDILITAANGSTQLVGKHAIIHGLCEKSAVPGGFMLLASSENPDFLNASMSSTWYGKFISQYVAGGNGALGNLNKTDLEEQVISVPSKEEQKKIGDFFRQLDLYISLQKEKLEKLRRLKAALLDKLFV